MPHLITLLYKHDLKEEVQHKITALITSGQAYYFILNNINAIYKLNNRALTQLNRKLNFEDWKSIAEKLETKSLYLWVDFLSFEQLYYLQSNLTQNKIDFKKILIKLEPNRFGDLLIHFDLKNLAKLFIALPAKTAAQFISKQCLNGRIIQLLIYVTYVAHTSDRQSLLNNIFEQLEFTRVKKDLWRQLRNDLQEHLFMIFDIQLRRTGEVEKKKDSIKRSTQILALLQDFDFDKSGIQHSWGKYKQKLVRAREEATTRSGSSIAKTRAVLSWENEKRKLKNLPFVYHSDLTGLTPTIVEPTKKASLSVQKAIHGAIKVVSHIDDQSMTFLEKNTANTISEQTYITQRTVLQNLITQVKSKFGRGLTSVTPSLLGIQPENGKLIVACGGFSLAMLQSSCEIEFSKNIFYSPCSDLKKMHQLNFYIRDIKPGNLIYKDTVTSSEGYIQRLPRAQLKFIDFETLCCTRPELCSHDSQATEVPYSFGGTFWYSTLVHICLLNQDTALQTPQQLKAKDEYAFLITLLESISYNFRKIKKLQFKNDKIEGKMLTDFAKNDSVPCKELEPYMHGVLTVLKTSSDKDAVILLLNQLIKPQAHQRIINFLYDPSANPLPEGVYLYDLINWQ